MQGGAERRAQPAWPRAEVAEAAVEAAVEPWGAVEGEVRAGPPVVVAVEPRAAVELGVEPWGAPTVAVAPRAGLRAEVAMEEEPWGAPAVAVAPRAGPRAEAAMASPSGEERWAEVCRSIRRICFPAEKICGTWGTLPGGWLVQPGRVALAATAVRAPVVPPPVAAVRSARSWAQTPGSCFRRMRSVCNVQFLVHLRQRSCSMLFSTLVGVIIRRWL